MPTEKQQRPGGQEDIRRFQDERRLILSQSGGTRPLAASAVLSALWKIALVAILCTGAVALGGWYITAARPPLEYHLRFWLIKQMKYQYF
jgi:hypothetical protein